MSTDTLPALSLPAELTIYTASETRAAWLAWLAAEQTDAASNAASDSAGGHCRVHAGAVDQIDAAGVQLLVALSHTLAQQQRRLQLLDPSTPLRAACAALGAGALLLDGAAYGAAFSAASSTTSPDTVSPRPDATREAA